MLLCLLHDGDLAAGWGELLDPLCQGQLGPIQPSRQLLVGLQGHLSLLRAATPPPLPLPNASATHLLCTLHHLQEVRDLGKGVLGHLQGLLHHGVLLLELLALLLDTKTQG